MKKEPLGFLCSFHYFWKYEHRIKAAEGCSKLFDQSI